MSEAYISATFEDLKECREAVRHALGLIGLRFKTMEEYVAGATAPLARCLDDVESCDIYIGIFAWRYGYTPPKQSKSITHLEYEHAVASGKDCLIFLLSEHAAWPVRFVDRGPKAAQVDALRDVLQREHLCSFFDAPADLGLLVYAAVHKLLEQRSRGVTAAPAVPVAPGLSAAVTAHYFERLRQQYGGLDLLNLAQQSSPYLGTQLFDVFVEPFARADHPPQLTRAPWGEGAGEAERLDRDALPLSWPGQPVFDVLCERAQRRFVLVGDPGAGKSAVVRYLTLALARAHADERLAPLAGHLPVLVELRSYAAAVAAGQCRNLREFLAHRAATDGYQEEPEGLSLHLARGDPAVVVFDGLDEILERRIREETAGQIATFAETFPEARVVVTTRPAEYNRRALAAAGFAHHTLQRFVPEQTAEFLRRWFEALPEAPGADATVRREVVIGTIRRSPELTELAGNPMLLSILAVIGRHRMLPKQRWRLYEQVAVTLVDSWDDSRMVDAPAGSQRLDAEVKHELLRGLAFDMMSGRLGHRDHVGGDQLRRIFTQHLERHGLGWAEAGEFARQAIDQLRRRSYVLGRYGRADYRFVHRTFQEFYCAWAIIERFSPGGSRFDEIRAVFRENWADPAWRETLRLVAGQLSAGFAAELVELLITEVNPEWWEYPGPSGRAPRPEPPWNVALAVQCLAGVRQIADARHAAELALREVVRIIEYSAATPDRDLPGPDYADLLVDEFIPAIEAIGPNWPDREAYLDWYRTAGVEIVGNPAAASAARIAAVLARPDDHFDEIFKARIGEADDVRVVCAAVAGLGEMAHQAVRQERADEGRLALDPLVRAADDARAVVRLASVQALAPLAAVYPEARAVLVRAVSPDPQRRDGFSTVRLSAVQILGERLRAEPGIEEILLECRRSDPHPAVRAGALRVLARPRQLSVAVAQDLVDACRDDTAPEVVEAAAGILLPRAGSDGPVRELLLGRMRTDPAAGVRRAAVRLLARSGPEARLLERIETDPDGAVVRAAAVALAGRGNRPGERSWQALVARLAAEPDEVLRVALVRVLGATYRAYPRTEEILTGAATSDTEPAVRLAAVSGLAALPAAPSREAVLARVAGQDPTPSVRRAAVESLAGDRGPTATRALITASVHDADTETRTAALRGLCGRILDPADARRLLELTGHGHPEIRLEALRVLIADCPPDIDLPALLLDRTSNDSVGEVFAAAARAAVLDRADAGHLWTVIAERAGADPNPEVRAAAVEILGSGGDAKAAGEVLRDRVRVDTDPAVVAAAARAAAALREDGTRTDLLARLAGADPVIRPVLIRALAHWITDDDVRRVLLSHARTAEAHEARRAAVEMLAPIAHLDEVRDILIDCAEDEDFAVRNTADALLRLSDRWPGSSR
ncbi:HEAT repeat domain-containing protein [Actinoplanes campanulatus]|uniref:HEAT repeat domain-containing protein n=3 Tax=Actinoplanes campanulatus TaxID=113559 RepID=UPI0031D5D87B